MTGGLYFMLSYTFAHAIDDGQDALVAGQPATVQNSYTPNSERGSSVTDQRQRLAFSWIVAPRPFNRGREWLGTVFNNWKIAGIATFTGPDYATTDLRVTRRIYAGDRLKMELVGESFNLL